METTEFISDEFQKKKKIKSWIKEKIDEWTRTVCVSLCPISFRLLVHIQMCGM